MCLSSSLGNKYLAIILGNIKIDIVILTILDSIEIIIETKSSIKKQPIILIAVHPKIKIYKITKLK